VFGILARILRAEMEFDDKAEARRFFHQLTQTTKDWNRVEQETEDFKNLQAKIEQMVFGKAEDA
jgi:V/A-type H+-transporting ATPase subunit A